MTYHCLSSANSLNLHQCAIIAAAVIGSFSWANVPDPYWLASALWFCSLAFSILGILLSAQQLGVLDLLGVPPKRAGARSAKQRIRRFLPLMLTEVTSQIDQTRYHNSAGMVGIWRPRWKMVFTWQCPVMFMSYSVLLYAVGLTIYVCSPLIMGDSGDQRKAS